ncbi:MAG: DUF3617 domain-containing protein [Thermodesulfobacteriota bacterium]
MFKKIAGLIAVLVCFVWLSCNTEAGPNMKEGLWEITMTMEIPGMPMKMPPRTWTQCLTKKNCVPQEEDKDCKVIKSEVKGDVFTWVIECKTREGTTTGNGRTVYKGDTFEGVIR